LLLLATFSGVPKATMVPPLMPAAGAHIDHKGGRADGLLVVLDGDHRVAQIAQSLECSEQPVVAALVQANARFVQDIDDADEPRNFDALRKTYRTCREFMNTEVTLENAMDGLKRKVQALGFGLRRDQT
jgi:NAD kinase